MHSHCTDIYFQGEEASVLISNRRVRVGVEVRRLVLVVSVGELAVKRDNALLCVIVWVGVG